MKNKRTILTIALVLLIGFLSYGCYYFYNKSNKPHVNIIIGTYSEYDGATYFSDPIEDIAEVNSINQGLAILRSIEKPEICKEQPNHVILVNEVHGAASYLKIKIWMDNERVIFSTGEEENLYGADYKEAIGSWKEYFKELIEKYKVDVKH